MKIVGFHINKREIPSELLHQFPFTAEEKNHWVTSMGIPLEEILMLSTCERLDIYSLVAHAKPIQLVLENLGLGSGLFDVLHGQNAVKYFMETAAGLQSSLLGESEILRQIKACLPSANSTKLHPTILALLTEVIKVGKKVRTNTSLSQYPVSYSGLTIRRLVETIKKNPTLQICIIGGGSLGKSIIKGLTKKGIQNMTIISRCSSHAQHISQEFGIQYAHFNKLKEAVLENDIIVGTSYVEQAVLDASYITDHERSSLWIDLGNPANFNYPSINDSRFISLVDLTNSKNEHYEKRKTAIPAAKKIIDITLKQFADNERLRSIYPVITAFRNKSQHYRDSLAQTIEDHLSSADMNTQQMTEAILKSVAKQYYHQPLQKLKSIAKNPEQNFDAVSIFKDLFDLKA